ncbi:MAG: single-stranded DNA-binding protein [Candidatus Omnitrophica bacterium]|nr:single-stranded DNA-binding protein [Candidatus Omnitrophota bacterium]
MANLNKVFLIGNLTRDPELRYIPSGTAVATFTLATGRVYTMASGEKREETCFVRCVAWARQAELCGEYLSKGSPVFVEGRLQSRSWESPDGQKRSTIEVVIQNIQFLGRGPAKGAAGEAVSTEEPVGAGREAVSPAGEPAGISEISEAPPEGDEGEVPF